MVFGGRWAFGGVSMFISIFCPELKAGTGLSLVDFAYSFSPLVEETDLMTVVIDVEGCELVFGSVYQLANEISRRAMSTEGLRAKVNVAIAGNPDTAVLAAKFYRGVSFIAEGEELSGLREIPITNLRSQISDFRSQISNPKREKDAQKEFEQILETLKLWGVHTFGEFAALPVNGVSERLGQLGVKLQQLAGGNTKRHLVLKQHAPVFHYQLELEHPVAELEPLSFIFARLLNQLCAALNSYALATNELRLQLTLENQQLHERVLNLPHPMCDSKVFLKLLLLDTEMHPPPAAVVAVSLAGEPVRPRRLQEGLFIPLAPAPEKLELTLARLAKLLGPENVGAPELIDTHRPDAFRINRFVLKRAAANKRGKKKKKLLRAERQCQLGFRAFRPPLRAVVEAARGYPTQLSAWSKRMSVYGKVVQLAGPWRTTGDWWRGDSWARDEWDVAVETRNGAPALYRLYRELRNGAWFVEGSYD